VLAEHSGPLLHGTAQLAALASTRRTQTPQSLARSPSTLVAPRCSSIRMSLTGAGDGSGSGTNLAAGCLMGFADTIAPTFSRSASVSLTQRRTRFALMPWAMATDADETPGLPISTPGHAQRQLRQRADASGMQRSHEARWQPACDVVANERLGMWRPAQRLDGGQAVLAPMVPADRAVPIAAARSALARLVANATSRRFTSPISAREDAPAPRRSFR
jgi:hypothetical protein